MDDNSAQNLSPGGGDNIVYTVPNDGSGNPTPTPTNDQPVQSVPQPEPVIPEPEMPEPPSNPPVELPVEPVPPVEPPEEEEPKKPSEQVPPNLAKPVLFSLIFLLLAVGTTFSYFAFVKGGMVFPKKASTGDWWVCSPNSSSTGFNFRNVGMTTRHVACIAKMDCACPGTPAGHCDIGNTTRWDQRIASGQTAECVYPQLPGSCGVSQVDVIEESPDGSGQWSGAVGNCWFITNNCPNCAAAPTATPIPVVPSPTPIATSIPTQPSVPTVTGVPTATNIPMPTNTLIPAPTNTTRPSVTPLPTTPPGQPTLTPRPTVIPACNSLSVFKVNANGSKTPLSNNVLLNTGDRLYLEASFKVNLNVQQAMVVIRKNGAVVKEEPAPFNFDPQTNYDTDYRITFYYDVASAGSYEIGAFFYYNGAWH